MGLVNGQVRLENNYELWKKMYEEEKNELVRVFNKDSFIIEHVGSTSVKGLLAKPIVDIAVGLGDFKELDKYMDTLKEIYTIKDNISKNEILLIKENEKETTYLIHVLLINDKRYKDMIRFRDILINNPDVLQEYNNLKVKLSMKYSSNREMYSETKNDFIEMTLKEFSNNYFI